MSENSTISGYYVGTTNDWDFVIQQDKPNQDRPFLKVDSQGRVTLPYQPFFNARLSHIVENQTGQGRVATLIADEVITDIGNNYNNLTGEFKAPVSGVYNFNCNILARGIVDSMINAIIELDMGGYVYMGTYENPAPARTYNADKLFRISQAAYLLAGQLVTCSLSIASGPANTVSFYGVPNSRIWSGFSGYLIA